MLKRIIIHKDILFDTIDAMTYKFADTGLADKPDEVKDGASSDREETLDETLMNTYAISRDGKLRDEITFCLRDYADEISNNLEAEDSFVYELNVDKSFSGSQLRVVFSLISDYLTKGVLYDWYSNIGSDAANKLAEELETLPTRIMEVLRPSFVSKTSCPEIVPYSQYLRGRR